MNKIEKLFKKLSVKDRELLLFIIQQLRCGNKKLDVKKLSGSDFYRLRKGKFRIIFHHTSKNEIIIDSIKLRDNTTYKNL